MSCIRRLGLIFLACLAASGSLRAEGFILGAGAATDSEGGLAFSAFGDFGVLDNTWLSITAGASETAGTIGDFSTTFADVGVDHYFGPVGVRLSAAYWGDPDILDSEDLRASVYFRNESASVALDYDRREFDFVFGPSRFRDARRAEFHADGWGLTARFNLDERFTLRVNGISYDYSRDIRVQPNIDVLRFFSASRLSLVNSLLDHRVSAGLEYRFGLRSVDLTLGNWRTAVDQSNVHSVTLGFLTPMTDRTDIEFRLSLDDSETFGNTTALTVYLYYFGGS